MDRKNRIGDASGKSGTGPGKGIRESGGDGRLAESGAGTLNRSGLNTSPDMALDLIREAQRTPPGIPGDSRLLAEYRGSYIREKTPIGSKPVPAASGRDRHSAAKGAGSIFLDKLGERLAFERRGVRLYECLIGKVMHMGMVAGGPSLEDLEHILEEERKHFHFLQRAIIGAGGDPTAQSPCADIAGVLSQGAMQIVADPRTTLAQSLEAVLQAELADNDGWNMLRNLAMAVGARDLDDMIREAQEHEEEHLTMVRDWLSSLVIGGDAASWKAMWPETESGKVQAGQGKKAAAKPESGSSNRSGPKATGKAKRPDPPGKRGNPKPGKRGRK